MSHWSALYRMPTARTTWRVLSAMDWLLAATRNALAELCSLHSTNNTSSGSALFLVKLSHPFLGPKCCWPSMACFSSSFPLLWLFSLPAHQLRRHTFPFRSIIEALLIQCKLCSANCFRTPRLKSCSSIIFLSFDCLITLANTFPDY